MGLSHVAVWTRARALPGRHHFLFVFIFYSIFGCSLKKNSHRIGHPQRTRQRTGRVPMPRISVCRLSSPGHWPLAGAISISDMTRLYGVRVPASVQLVQRAKLLLCQGLKKTRLLVRLRVPAIRQPGETLCLLSGRPVFMSSCSASQTQTCVHACVFYVKEYESLLRQVLQCGRMRVYVCQREERAVQ
jgi:hypothetical protein